MARGKKTTGRKPVKKLNHKSKNTGSIETATLWGHYYHNSTIVSGGTAQTIDQINIIPTLSDFDELLNQAQFYQQYKIKKVQYRLKCVNVFAGMAGTKLSASNIQPLIGDFDIFKVKV
jgi:hypothetical protein